jgi:PAS domain S-box-containing protein
VNTARRTRFITCVCCFVVIASWDGRSAAQTPPATRTVLLLQESSDVGGSVRARFDAAFAEALRADTSSPVELYEETVESERFPGADQARVFRSYLTKKYAGRKIDVIVAQGFGPLNFARQYRGLFGNPPIVTTVSAPGQLDSNDNVIGLQGGFWVGDTISLAKQLLPETRSVYVIDGTNEDDSALEGTIRHQWRQRHSDLALVYLRNLTLTDLVARLEAIPPHSIVVFIRQSVGTASASMDDTQGLTQVVRASPVPVFTLVEEFVGHGVIGGRIWRFETDARRVATMARRLASGTSARDVPIGRNTYDTILDWQQLQRWGIRESRIPAGSIVRFRPKSFMDLYGGYVAGGVAVFAAQLMLIVGLLAQRARRRRAEQDARMHATRYQSVVDAQSDMICRFLPDTTLTFVNDAYCQFWNKSRDELLGHPFIEMIPAAARPGVIDDIRRLRQGSDSQDHPVCLPDGSEGWHRWIHSAIVDQHGRVTEYQGVGRDITDQKRAENALRTAEQRNSAILRAIPDLMFVLRRDGTYVDYHARDPSVIFLAPEKFLGRSVRDIMPPDLTETVMEAIERCCVTGEAVVIEFELDVGYVRYNEARLVPLPNDQVLSIVRDVTEARRARELNRALAGRLIVSQEEERQRIARELHDDLSQKIAVLNIEVDRLSHQLATSEHRTRLRGISAQVGEIAEHLHDLSYELHPARLQTLGLVESLRVMCSEFSHQRSIDVTFTAAESELPLVIDPVSLCVYRITQEALHNIARHSHATEASVELSFEGNDICLQIADSGVGFEPHSSRHTGLGLVSMRERVGVLNGKLVIHTAHGRGTRIVARIPLPMLQHAPLPQRPRLGDYSVSSSVSIAGSTSTSTDSTTDVITGPADVIS